MFKRISRHHIRNTFLAGTFAVVPIAITIFAIYKVEEYTQFITERLFGHYIPAVGVLIVLLFIYFVGMLVSSVIGRFFIRIFDAILTRIPLLKEIYAAWKQVSFTPGGGEGMYAKVVLIPTANAKVWQLGFTNGETVTPDSTLIPVFVPNSPNPIMGQFYLVEKNSVRETPLGADEAFKILISSGNYVPDDIVSSDRTIEHMP